jgi:hypothetical protein
MKQLSTGQFYGQTNETFHLNGITLTDTEYTHSKVDWHYHQNPYFTFILHYGQPYAHPQVNKMLSDYILPAINGF